MAPTIRNRNSPFDIRNQGVAARALAFDKEEQGYDILCQLEGRELAFLSENQTIKIYEDSLNTEDRGKVVKVKDVKIIY